MPPTGEPDGRIRGTVVDQDSGQPVPGILVQFGGHDSGFTGTLAAITDASGRYELRKLFPGTYPKVSASGPGFEPQVQTVTLSGDDNHGKGKGKDDNRVNFVLRREWFSWLVPKDAHFVDRPVLWGRLDLSTDTKFGWFTINSDAKFYFLLYVRRQLLK